MQGVYGEAVCFPYTEYILRQNKSHFFQSADRQGKMTIADLTGRVEAKTILLSLNSNCPAGEERTSNARPYGCGIVVKSASAKKNITIVTGRDTGNKNY